MDIISTKDYCSMQRESAAGTIEFLIKKLQETASEIRSDNEQVTAINDIKQAALMLIEARAQLMDAYELESNRTAPGMIDLDDVTPYTANARQYGSSIDVLDKVIKWQRPANMA